MYRSKVAMNVRLNKEKHPELYCSNKRCLWRTGGGDCPRHKLAPKPVWRWRECSGLAVNWFEIEGLDCLISLEPRPHYCDRGNWLAKVELKSGADPRRLNLDFQDGWPRYYMNFDRAKMEIQDWMEKRGQRNVEL